MCYGVVWKERENAHAWCEAGKNTAHLPGVVTQETLTLWQTNETLAIRNSHIHKAHSFVTVPGKFTLYHVMRTQRGSRGIALFFL